jgi:hypothetical protein
MIKIRNKALQGCSINMLLRQNHLYYLQNSSRRLFSTDRTAVKTTLDELLRPPILDRSNSDPDTLQDLDAFPVPILPRQVSESLRKEFGYPVTCKTEWEFSPKTLEEVRGDWWRAARMIHETLATWRNRPGNPIEPSIQASATCQRPSRGIEEPELYAQSALAWIQAECTKMYAEIQSGCTLRYESAEHLLPPELAANLSKELEKLIQPALIAIGRAKHLHPAIKKEIIGHICSVITASHKAQ